MKEAKKHNSKQRRTKQTEAGAETEAEVEVEAEAQAEATYNIIRKLRITKRRNKNIY